MLEVIKRADLQAALVGPALCFTTTLSTVSRFIKLMNGKPAVHAFLSLGRVIVPFGGSAEMPLILRAELCMWPSPSPFRECEES